MKKVKKLRMSKKLERPATALRLEDVIKLEGNKVYIRLNVSYRIG